MFWTNRLSEGATRNVTGSDSIPPPRTRKFTKPGSIAGMSLGKTSRITVDIFEFEGRSIDFCADVVPSPRTKEISRVAAIAQVFTTNRPVAIADVWNIWE